MSNKFLLINGSNINLSDGTTTLFGDTIGADNLSASMPVKTNSNKQLVSTKLNISDINNLQSTLTSLSDGDVIGPATSTTNAITRYADTTGKLLKNSTVTLNDGGVLNGIYNLTATNIIRTPTILTDTISNDYGTSFITMGLSNITIDAPLIATGTVEAKDFKTSTHTSFNTDITNLETKTQNQTALGINNTYFSGVLEANILKKVGGTNIQYLMADGSSLTQSASSGNSNFYLYKIDTSMTTTPASGFVSFNTVNQSLATIIYISHQTSDGIDVEVFFKQITTLSEVYIQDQNNSTLFIQYNITSAPTLTANSKIQIPVTVSTSGTTGFPNNHSILVSFFQNGLEVDTRLSSLETKTQNQTAVAGTTNFLGTTNFNAGFYDQQIKFSFNTAINNIDSLMSGSTGFADLYINALKVITSVVELNNIRTSGGQISVDANLDMSQNSINDLATPANDYDAANKLYVDSAVLFKPIGVGYTASTTGAVVICSVRRVKDTYTGACCRIRRSSDSAEKDIYFDNFSLVDKTAFNTFVGGGTGFIKIMYDQSGNVYNYQQLETAKQPTLVFNGDIPEILFNTGDQNRHFDSAQTTFTMGLTSGTYSKTIVFDSSSTGIQFPFSALSGAYECHLGAATNNIRIITGGDSRDFTANWTTAGYHRLTMLCGANSSNVRFDGTTNTPQAVTSISTNNLNLTWGIRAGETYDFEGRMNELIVWNIIPSNAVLLAIETDQVALWTNSIKATSVIPSSYNYNVKITNSKELSSYTDPNELVSKGYVDELVGSHKIYTTSTFPTASTNVGRIIYNSDTNSLFLSNGVTWSELFSWTQPIMTSMTSPSPYIVTTSSEITVGSAWKAFDRLLTSANWWHTATGLFNSAGDYIGVAGKPGIANNGAWLVLQMDIARSISRYTYHTRHDGIDGVPRSWHIIYSNDGINYLSADNKVNVSLVINTAYTYTFTPIIAKYWGIQIYKVNGTGTIHITQDLTFYSI